MATELERLIAKEVVVAECKPGRAKPPAWVEERRWLTWDVTLKYHGRRMTTPFYTSRGEPHVADVLCSMCREARSLDEAPTFEAWAKKHNCSTDSRAAYALWEGISKSTPRLKQFLGRKFKEFCDARHR